MAETAFIKTACQACEGRLELPMEAVGVAFACPRCGTQLELALKCACAHCGNPLSFPKDYIGQDIECGHCHNSTTLMPSALIADDSPADEEPEFGPVEDEEPEPASAQLKSKETQPIRTKSAPETAKAPPRRPSQGGPASGAPPKRPNQGGPAPDTPPQRPNQGGPAPSAPPKRPNQGGPAPDGPPQRPNQGGPAPSAPPKRPNQGGPAPDAPPQRPNQGGPAPSAPPKRPNQGGPAPDAPSQNQNQGGPAPGAPPKRPSQTPAKDVQEPPKPVLHVTSDDEANSEPAKKRPSVFLMVIKIILGFGAVGALTWFIILPLTGLGGSEFFFPREQAAPLPTFKPDPEVLKVNSLKIEQGEFLTELKGSISNDGKQKFMNVKITFSLLNKDNEPNEFTHTINQALDPGSTVQFSASVSFEPAPGATPEVVLIDSDDQLQLD